MRYTPRYRRPYRSVSRREYQPTRTGTVRESNPSPGVQAEIEQETTRIARSIFSAVRQLTIANHLPDGITREVAEDFFDENRAELLEQYEQAISELLQAKKGKPPGELLLELIRIHRSTFAGSGMPVSAPETPAPKREEPKAEIPEQAKEDLRDVIASVSALKLLQLSDAMDAPLPAGFLASLPRKLLSFQRAGVSYMNLTGRTLLADEQGTGKTTQALSTLRLLLWQGRAVIPCLVMCPKNVKFNWALEIIRVCPEWKDRICLLGESRDVTIDVARVGKVTLLGESNLRHGQIILCNYDLLYSRSEELLEIPFQAMIADESHRFKNPEAMRTEAVLELVDELDPPYRFALTGTPFISDTMELWPQIEFLGLDERDEFANFKERFGIRIKGVEDNKGLTRQQESTLLEMNKVLRSVCMVRRKKEDVLRDLPPKRRYTHCIEIDNRAEYDAAYEEFQAWLIEQYLTRMKYVIGLLHGS
jgi:SNF2 family DNA or RNA helicase